MEKSKKKKVCELCKLESKTTKWRVMWKKVLCFHCHCEIDKPNQRLLDYRVINWSI